VTLSLHLVTWNGARYISPLFASLKKSTHYSLPTTHLLVLDNGSTDGTVELLKRELVDLPFSHQLIERKDNIGFAGGHNHLFLKASEANEANEVQYVLMFNQDMEFEPECIPKLVQFLDAHSEAAAVAPRLMRLGQQSKQLKQSTQSKQQVIDSLGLKKYRT
jgi:GT2 family glycosyltransferase